MRETVKYHWWWEPTYQGNPITSRGISTEPAPNPPPGPWTVVSPLPVTARNVTITSATASGGVGASGGYWLFDPTPYTPENPPQLTVTYETDKLRTEFTTTTLKVYRSARTDDTPLATITATSSTDASSQQITWNGMENGQLVEKGIYVFDLNVEAAGSLSEPESGLGDGDDHKSPSTRIASTGAQEVGWDENTQTAAIRVAYRLADDEGLAASSAEIRVHRPDFTLYGTYPCGGLSPGQDYSVDIPVVLQQTGGCTWYFVLCAVDDHDTTQKGHRDCRVLPRSASANVVAVTVTFPDEGSNFKWGLKVIVKGSVRGFCSTPVTCQLYVDGSLKGETDASAEGNYKFAPPGSCWDTEAAGAARGWHNIVVKATDPEGCQGESAPRPVFVRRMIWPVTGSPSSEYCVSRPQGRHHNGIDIAAPAGTDIAAAEDGEASAVAYQDLGGYYRSVNHGTWYVELLDPADTSYRTAAVTTTYCHMQPSSEGEAGVQQGDAIGQVGCTGHSTCNHLHFIVRESGQAVDPRTYLP